MPLAKRKTIRTHKKLRYEDLVSTRPDTLAGIFMRRFWQPIHRAEDLSPGQAKPIEIMSERFTLYRGETGTPHVVDFRCPAPRHAALGWLDRRRLDPLHVPRLAIRRRRSMHRSAGGRKIVRGKNPPKELPNSAISRFDLRILRRR